MLQVDFLLPRCCLWSGEFAELRVDREDQAGLQDALLGWVVSVSSDGEDVSSEKLVDFREGSLRFIVPEMAGHGLVLLSLWSGEFFLSLSRCPRGFGDGASGEEEIWSCTIFFGNKLTETSLSLSRLLLSLPLKNRCSRNGREKKSISEESLSLSLSR